MKSRSAHRSHLEPLVVTLATAAPLLGVSVSQVRQDSRAGRIPTVRLGRRVLIARADLEALVTSSSIRGHKEVSK